VLHSGRLWPYSQTLDQTSKAFRGQTLLLITNTCKLLNYDCNKFTTLGPVACTINVYDHKFYYRKLRLSLERSYDHKIVILAKAS
jgi:hypothetical protein